MQIPDTSDEDAETSAEVDWSRDTARWDNKMTKEAFASSMFELADIWTENINEEEVRMRTGGGVDKGGRGRWTLCLKLFRVISFDEEARATVQPAPHFLVSYPNTDYQVREKQLKKEAKTR